MSILVGTPASLWWLNPVLPVCHSILLFHAEVEYAVSSRSMCVHVCWCESEKRKLWIRIGSNMHNSSGSMPLSPGFVPCFFPLSIQFHPLIAPFHPTPTPLVLAYLFWWVASSPPLWQSALQKSVPLAEYKWHQ